ncbi:MULTISPECIES: BrnT family toxin [unclassified Novosphingobium]|uniref:BrnT family toxin n=1 Tax=unclassified Novosphingobium TaxID=2644732 RepID=UPI000EEC6DDE|nr:MULTISPECIES: BrnT family toxin [unclassified Novosphingobium]HCF24673.1 BrnT family toxin [Novosphingobium sp.]HQV03931.1 BrnT family toxin [Novosphingobium sp.]
MDLEYDEEKRQRTLRERGLNFSDATKVFDSLEIELVDDRFDYGEVRIISFGQIDDRPVAIVWTPRGTHRRRIISMRYVHEREIEARKRALD